MDGHGGFQSTMGIFREGASRGMSFDNIKSEIYRFSAKIYNDLTVANYVTILPFMALSRSVPFSCGQFGSCGHSLRGR